MRLFQPKNKKTRFSAVKMKTKFGRPLPPSDFYKKVVFTLSVTQEIMFVLIQ